MFKSCKVLRNCDLKSYKNLVLMRANLAWSSQIGSEQCKWTASQSFCDLVVGITVT